MFTSAVKQSKLVPCIIFAGVQHLGVSWVNTSVKADILINVCCWIVCMGFVPWLHSITYKSEDKTLGACFSMFVSSVCDSTLLGFGSKKAHFFPTQRAFLSLGETVIKPVYWVQTYPLHHPSNGSSFHFSVCISCEKTHLLQWHLKNRKHASIKGRENFLKRYFS